jgi:hypothetical protein
VVGYRPAPLPLPIDQNGFETTCAVVKVFPRRVRLIYVGIDIDTKHSSSSMLNTGSQQ